AGAASGPVYGNAVFFGDSQAYGENNGGYSFVDVLAESGVFADVKKHAVSSSTIGPYGSVSQYCLINQIETYKTDIQNADIVFLEYGANDAYYSIENGLEVGKASDGSGATTICGYAKRAIDRIYELKPGVRIIYLAYAGFKGDEVKLGATYVDQVRLMDYALLYEATLYRMLRQNGITVIDMGNNRAFKDGGLSSDGGHLNTTGHERVAETILQHMNSVRPEPNLYRVFKANTTDYADYTIDGYFLDALWMLEAGGVDITLQLTTPSHTMIFRPTTTYGRTVIEFTGFSNGGEAGKVAYTHLVWNSNGTLTMFAGGYL
ncbi:MAG: SGNH/GDSL hydrolase family protein, partial [Clostridia bacterium]|nr:SGNH/GDSL hydrolase family protein [Clostridia bacterium]